MPYGSIPESSSARIYEPSCGEYLILIERLFSEGHGKNKRHAYTKLIPFGTDPPPQSQ
jgi:hypothetical protein